MSEIDSDFLCMSPAQQVVDSILDLQVQGHQVQTSKLAPVAEKMELTRQRAVLNKSVVVPSIANGFDGNAAALGLKAC